MHHADVLGSWSVSVSERICRWRTIDFEEGTACHVRHRSDGKDPVWKEAEQEEENGPKFR